MKKYILQIALISAIAAILIFLMQVVYIGGFMYFILLGICSLIIFVTIPVFVLRQYRKDHNGMMLFGDAFKMVFLGLMISAVVSSIFQLTYTSFIDPEFPARVANKTVEMTYGFLEGQVPDDQAEQILRDSETQTLERYTFAGVIKSLGIFAIVNAVLSLIIAAIMKRNPDNLQSTTVLDR